MQPPVVPPLPSEEGAWNTMPAQLSSHALADVLENEEEDDHKHLKLPGHCRKGQVA